MEGKNVAVIGAGLCGSLLALRLAMRGCEVSLFEKREDLRKEEMLAGRSINLALSNRGLKALNMVGLAAKAKELCIPMYGRMIHALDGTTRFMPYSGRKENYINSIGRGDLNALILDACDENPRIEMFFNSGCKHADVHHGYVKFKNDQILQFDAVFGADGAGSVIRHSMQEQLGGGFTIDQQILDHSYKELSILPGKHGQWQLDKNALHIWPRGGFMLIALPNLDGSFTVTLFLGNEGEKSFAALKSDEKIKHFFKEEFADAMALMPNLLEEYHQHPIGLLGTIKCSPWHVGGKTLLMGDAAHAIVPFYGQGMNASFEDVRVLDYSIHKYTSLPLIFDHFQHNRMEHTNAIADLAIDNYYEMRDKVADQNFIKKRAVEMELEAKYPDYFSKYSMVTFREDLPYGEAKELGEKQDKLLINLVNGKDVQELDIDNIYQQLKKL